MSVCLFKNDWGVVKKGWDAQVKGEAPHKFVSALDGLKKLKEADPKLDDQYFPPFVIVGSDGKPVGPILDNDAVVSFNFRADRMVMAAKAFDLEKFDKFDRGKMPKIKYAGMLQYDADLNLPKQFLVAPPLIEKTSGEYLVHNYVKSWACRLANVSSLQNSLPPILICVLSALKANFSTMLGYGGLLTCD